jgi:hypothetical protein
MQHGSVGLVCIHSTIFEGSLCCTVCMRICVCVCVCVSVCLSLFVYIFGEVECLFDRVQYGSGTLFLTTENITWISSSDPDKALSFHWRSMLMHAISRDTSSFAHPCIFCQVCLSVCMLLKAFLEIKHAYVMAVCACVCMLTGAQGRHSDCRDRGQRCYYFFERKESRGR